MSQGLLEVRNLSTYLRSGQRQVKAVEQISFSIPAGETFCLVGESGSGKSVSALSVMRLLPPDLASHPSGEILFNGQDLLKLDDPGIRQIRGGQIAMIFQEPMTSLNPVLNIGEQISETLLLHHPEMSLAEAEQRTIMALEQVQIPQAASRMRDYPHQLSGGQRQRVMIAMALACQPQLLIADEPTTALDVTVQAEILRLMRELQDQIGMSMLFITHDFGVVAEMAHTVGVMQHGRLLETGNTAQVLRNPQHPYTQKLLAALPENLTKPCSAGPLALSVQESGVAQPVPLLQIRDLKVWFPVKKGLFRSTVDYVRAVDDVSLDIGQGQIVALVGESGCGKTTLGRAVLQLEQPTSGSIQIQGQELVGLSGRELRPLRRKMQIAFQDPQSSLNPRLLVETALTEPMKVHGIGENQEQRLELAAQILESVQLQREFLWRYPHEFSGGQRQRIGLARALSVNPEFIVCDEITSALDVSVQAEILQLLLSIREQRNLTLLFISHNIGVVEYLSDQTVVMYKGKIVEQGETERICRQPEHPYTQKLLAAVPKIRF
ncbi:ABC transporter ATP-binding protein [Methylomonas paludis]|uniref:ABC transporter ATP-binding protein n=1 Tax=Methylomonas paludis TaxID=1173101 RepID=A0A975MM70_9GAMM|nr:dipeptide ABC transporter ATP-binding protein [Methylomonas paludis]QWF70372.1 ABC transporter ATP-binding protein [Methylomonas paludis]